jgi:hypothetical protein
MQAAAAKPERHTRAARRRVTAAPGERRVAVAMRACCDTAAAVATQQQQQHGRVIECSSTAPSAAWSGPRWLDECANDQRLMTAQGAQGSSPEPAREPSHPRAPLPLALARISVAFPSRPAKTRPGRSRGRPATPSRCPCRCLQALVRTPTSLCTFPQGPPLRAVVVCR